jgi:DNA-binding Lrp family transcriptional regulator
MAVPPAKLAAIAEVVNRFPEVNHNYEREHRYNLWFVVTAGSEGRLQAALGASNRWPAGRCWLPLLQEYHIDLGFALDGQDERPGSGACAATLYTADAARRGRTSSGHGPAGGAAAVHSSVSVLASRLGCDESEVLERIRRWCAEGIIKRFGVIVRHHELGYTANAMLVHDIPDAGVDEVGERLARAAGVNLCYRRPRVPPEWRYNLFCMIHGQARAEVEARIAELRARCS